MAKDALSEVVAEQMDHAGGYIAVQQEQKPKPAFTVRKLQGTYMKRMNIFDKAKNKILSKEVETPRGYLVTFLKGHSIHAVDDEHLRRIKADLQMIPVMNEEGATIGHMPNRVAA